MFEKHKTLKGNFLQTNYFLHWHGLHAVVGMSLFIRQVPSNLIKNWTHPSMTCTLTYSMLKDCWVSFKNLYKYFMIGPGLVTFCLPTSNCIFLKEHFACIVLFFVHCCLQPQLSQVQFLQDPFSYKTILNHFTKMTR